jgi:hypothetical protein
VVVFRTDLCSFSGFKIYPGHGRRFIRGDSKVGVSDIVVEIVSWC